MHFISESDLHLNSTQVSNLFPWHGSYVGLIEGGGNGK